MIWYLLFALLLGFVVWLNHEGKDRWSGKRRQDWEGTIVGLVMATLFGGSLLFVGGAMVSSYGPLEKRAHGDYTLTAVKDDSQVSGGHYLFSGYVDESQVFNFYEKTGPNTYQRGYQLARYSLIVEDQPEGKAFLRQYHLVPNKWIAFPWMTHLRNEFHVPPGSVPQEINFDNE